jgi:EAL domain-containing protein (putative c-di-GMP-specific phosphodiesterase class I)
MVDLEADSVVGYEALLRWRNPVRSLLRRENSARR